MNPSIKAIGYQRGIYIWLSVALLAPVLLLPLRLAYGAQVPIFGVDIESRWLLLAACLLLVGVTADSILRMVDGRQNIAHASSLTVYFNAGWILLVSVAVPYLVGHPSLVWCLAALFLLQAYYAAYALWNDHDGWWLWCAWWRDITAALTLFVWPAYWPAY